MNILAVIKEFFRDKTWDDIAKVQQAHLINERNLFNLYDTTTPHIFDGYFGVLWIFKKPGQIKPLFEYDPKYDKVLIKPTLGIKLEVGKEYFLEHHNYDGIHHLRLPIEEK